MKTSSSIESSRVSRRRRGAAPWRRSPSGCVATARIALIGLAAMGALVAHASVVRADDSTLLPADVAQALSANAHWASGVVAFSSQYSPTGWSAAQALGEADTYPSYGDHNTAWASQTPDGQREFIELSFTNPLPANYLVAAETFNPGAIDSAYAWNPNAGHYDLVWTAPATQPGMSSRLWAITFPTTAYPVARVRLALNSPAILGWNEIDAVGIGANGFISRQWAASAVASSQYEPVYHAPAVATGPPDLYPTYGDGIAAWASQTADGSREWLQLEYDSPEAIARVLVYETYNPGAIDSIYVRNALDDSLHLVYAAVPEAQPQVATILAAEFPRTAYPVDAVRITLASDVVPGWNEIDAVMIADSTDMVLPGITAVPGVTPRRAGIESASPNPFRSGSTIQFSLPENGPVSLRVFDVRGACVTTLAAGTWTAGAHALVWNGRDESGRRVAAGLYFLALEAAGTRDVRRLVRLR